MQITAALLGSNSICSGALLAKAFLKKSGGKCPGVGLVHGPWQRISAGACPGWGPFPIPRPAGEENVTPGLLEIPDCIKFVAQ